MPETTELSQLILKEQCGWNVTNSDQLSQLLENLAEDHDSFTVKGQRARKVYLDNFQESIILNRYLKVIKDQIHNVDSDI